MRPSRRVGCIVVCNARRPRRDASQVTLEGIVARTPEADHQDLASRRPRLPRAWRGRASAKGIAKKVLALDASQVMFGLAMSNQPNTPASVITAETPTPWAIYRDIVLEDGTVLESIRIVVETVDRVGGFALGDWFADLNATHALRNLSDEQRDEAVDAVGDYLAEVEADLAVGLPTYISRR